MGITGPWGLNDFQTYLKKEIPRTEQWRPWVSEAPGRKIASLFLYPEHYNKKWIFLRLGSFDLNSERNSPGPGGKFMYPHVFLDRSFLKTRSMWWTHSLHGAQRMDAVCIRWSGTWRKTYHLILLPVFASRPVLQKLQPISNTKYRNHCRDNLESLVCALSPKQGHWVVWGQAKGSTRNVLILWCGLDVVWPPRCTCCKFGLQHVSIKRWRDLKRRTYCQADQALSCHGSSPWNPTLMLWCDAITVVGPHQGDPPRAKQVVWLCSWMTSEAAKLCSF